MKVSQEEKTVEENAKEKKFLDLYYLENMSTGFKGIDEESYTLNDSEDNKPKGYEIARPEVDFKLNEVGFGDEFFLFEGPKGNPKYENANEVWDNFIQWIRERRTEMEKEKEQENNFGYDMGEQLIEYANQRNAHGIYILTKQNWVEFRDTYLGVEGCPQKVMEFIYGIMDRKMTEKQMWGSDEDRMIEGTVIIFDQSLMPKEGEDTGKLKFEYRPNYRKEMLKEHGYTEMI